MLATVQAKQREDNIRKQSNSLPTRDLLTHRRRSSHTSSTGTRNTSVRRQQIPASQIDSGRTLLPLSSKTLRLISLALDHNTPCPRTGASTNYITIVSFANIRTSIDGSTGRKLDGQQAPPPCDTHATPDAPDAADGPQVCSARAVPLVLLRPRRVLGWTTPQFSSETLSSAEKAALKPRRSLDPFPKEVRRLVAGFSPRKLEMTRVFARSPHFSSPSLIPMGITHEVATAVDLHRSELARHSGV